MEEDWLLTPDWDFETYDYGFEDYAEDWTTPCEGCGFPTGSSDCINFHQDCEKTFPPKCGAEIDTIEVKNEYILTICFKGHPCSRKLSFMYIYASSNEEARKTASEEIQRNGGESEVASFCLAKIKSFLV